MTTALSLPATTATSTSTGTRLLDRCAPATALAAELDAVRAALTASPDSPVVLEIAMEDASSYAVLRLWQMREIVRDGQRLVAMDGQLIEMGSRSDDFSFPITMQEASTLLMPAISLTKNSSCAVYLSSPVGA